MAKPKLTKRAFLYKAPHLGMELAEEIKRLVVDDYIAPNLEASPPLVRLEVIVKTTR